MKRLEGTRTSEKRPEGTRTSENVPEGSTLRAWKQKTHGVYENNEKATRGYENKKNNQRVREQRKTTGGYEDKKNDQRVREQTKKRPEGSQKTARTLKKVGVL